MSNRNSNIIDIIALGVGGYLGYKAGKILTENFEIPENYPKTTKTLTTIAGAVIAEGIVVSLLDGDDDNIYTSKQVSSSQTSRRKINHSQPKNYVSRRKDNNQIIECTDYTVEVIDKQEPQNNRLLTYSTKLPKE
jgi:hypothetical protein